MAAVEALEERVGQVLLHLSVVHVVELNNPVFGFVHGHVHLQVDDAADFLQLFGPLHLLRGFSQEIVDQFVLEGRVAVGFSLACPVVGTPTSLAFPVLELDLFKSQRLWISHALCVQRVVLFEHWPVSAIEV